MPAPTNPPCWSTTTRRLSPAASTINVETGASTATSARSSGLHRRRNGAVHYLNNYVSADQRRLRQLPLPYVAGTIANIFPKVYDVEDHFRRSTTALINQLKYGFTRFSSRRLQPPTAYPQYCPPRWASPTRPPGQASTDFPARLRPDRRGRNTLTGWAANSSGGVAPRRSSPSTYAALDNLQWTKGKHSFTVGLHL